MKIPTVLLALGLLLNQSCTTLNKMLEGESYEYHQRIRDLPKDSLELAANGKMIPKNFDFLVGCKAPSFEATDLAGQPFASNFANKVTLLNFWFINCPPCVAEIPHLNTLQDKYRDQLTVIGLTNETAAAVLNFDKRRPIRYRVAPDARRILLTKYDFEWGYPKSFLIGPDGRIKMITRGVFGPDDPNYKKLENLIVELSKH